MVIQGEESPIGYRYQNWQILVFGCEFSSFRLFLGAKICGNRYLSGKPFIGYGIMCKNERVIEDGDPQIDPKMTIFFNEKARRPANEPHFFNRKQLKKLQTRK